MARQMTRAWGGRERCWDTNVQLGRKAEEGWQPVGREQSGGSAFSQGERYVCRKSGGEGGGESAPEG